MIDKIQSLWPEVALFAATCVVMLVGLSKTYRVRRLCGPVAGLALLASAALAWATTPEALHAFPELPRHAKALIGVVGALLVLLLSGTTDRDYEARVARGLPFDPLRSNRAEFYAFVLFSLTGLMLCAGADDLVWLFLALELTSLPTYIMVVISTQRSRGLEAGVKYFFLGALGAAVFLYGFAMLYGGTGSTSLVAIAQAIQAQELAGGINPVVMVGLVLSVLGLCFKIAAVPMHFYTADVYQGAASPVAGFLAFVPKTAGFLAIILIASVAGWGAPGDAGGGALPAPLHATLWVVAALTMTVGNVLALLQRSVKRILAYSSIAHSGYMLVGVVAGPGPGNDFARSGVAAVLFYLLSYGVINLGAFAVLSALERRGSDGSPEEVEDLADLRGLCSTRPVLGWTMVLSMVGLMGLPPLLGFFAKLPLFTSAISAGHVALVVIMGVNSAIAAAYYLRVAAACVLEPPDRAGEGAGVRTAPVPTRMLAGIASVVGLIGLVVQPMHWWARDGARFDRDAYTPRPAAGAATESVAVGAPGAGGAAAKPPVLPAAAEP